MAFILSFPSLSKFHSTLLSKKSRSLPIPTVGLVRVELESGFLTIIPRVRMGSKSIAHYVGQIKAEQVIDSEAMRAKGIIVLAKSN